MELSPLGHAQLSWAHKYQGRKTQGAASNECTFIAIYRSQKCADFRRLGDTREMAARLAHEAVDALSPYGQAADDLRALPFFLLDRPA